MQQTRCEICNYTPGTTVNLRPLSEVERNWLVDHGYKLSRICDTANETAAKNHAFWPNEKEHDAYYWKCARFVLHQTGYCKQGK